MKNKYENDGFLDKELGAALVFPRYSSKNKWFDDEKYRQCLLMHGEPTVNSFSFRKQKLLTIYEKTVFSGVARSRDCSGCCRLISEFSSNLHN